MFNDVENFVLNVSMVIVTVWIVDRFWRVFFDRKRQTVFSIIAWAVFCAFQLSFEYVKGDMNILGTGINMVLLMLLAICGYYSKGKLKYFLLIIFCAVWSLIEIFVFFLMGDLPIDKSQCDILGEVISKIFMIVFVYILPCAWNKKTEINMLNKYYFFLLLVPIGSIYIAVSEFYFLSNTFFLMITTSVLLIFNIMILEIYTKLNEIFVYEQERTVYAQQFDIIAKSTAAQEKMMEEFHEEKHDLINKLVALKSSTENSDKETVIAGINQIIDGSHVSEIISSSGNRTVDALINFKYAIAKEYGIDFKLKIFIPTELPIEQCDIGVVIGNAIDNAIDAVRECKVSEKRIEISMGVKKEAWVMIIKNPYEHEIKKDRNGKFLSTKKEKHRHGFGLNSIERIAEKYQGEIFAEAEDGIFSLTVMMNLRDI